MKKTLGWLTIKPEHIKVLKAFVLFRHACCNAIGFLSEMTMPSNMNAIILKLPDMFRKS